MSVGRSKTPAGMSSTVVDVTLSRSRYGDGASCARVREAHFDVEATFGSGTWDERGAVGADDGADDGQAKAVPVDASDPLRGNQIPFQPAFSR